MPSSCSVVHDTCMSVDSWECWQVDTGNTDRPPEELQVCTPGVLIDYNHKSAPIASHSSCLHVIVS